MSRNPLAWLDEELHALDAANLRRQLAERQGPQLAGRLVWNGKSLLNFGSNDYLGLAADPRLAAAVRDSLDTFGWGSGASPLVCGRASLHATLERELAAFEGTEAALLFPSGFAANVGTVAALVGKGDVVFSDAKNHASLIDGCRLSGATVRIYAHADAGSLAGPLAQSGEFRRRMIVTDSLFSMDGDLAPLSDLAELAERHRAMLLVDEAHATGVFGPSGRGVAEFLGVEDGVHVRIGTLSKALGSVGGFVAGSQTLIDWLANRARPYVFSTASPEATAAASLATLAIVRGEPHRCVELLARAAEFRARLAKDGWNVGRSASQIVPVYIGSAKETMRLAGALREQGIFVPGIRPPSVPEGESLLRISLSYSHTPEMLDTLLEALRSARS